MLQLIAVALQHPADMLPPQNHPHAALLMKLFTCSCAIICTVPPPPPPLPPATPRHRYTGMTVIELGSGPGLAGLLAAKLGAQVVITDKAVVLPLIQENITLNGISHTPSANCSGTAEVCGWVRRRGGTRSWDYNLRLRSHPKPPVV